jgi:hypothetical protein
MFDHFLDFNRLVEDEIPWKIGDHGISPILRDFWDFRVYVMGIGCQPMGLFMSKIFL